MVDSSCDCPKLDGINIDPLRLQGHANQRRYDLHLRWKQLQQVIVNLFRFSTDTGFLLMISEIRERKKGAAKVAGEFWNVSVGKRNLLSFFGVLPQSSAVLHHNCVYALRSHPH